MTLREGDHMRLQIDPALSKGNLIKKYFFGKKNDFLCPFPSYSVKLSLGNSR